MQFGWVFLVNILFFCTKDCSPSLNEYREKCLDLTLVFLRFDSLLNS